MSKLVAMRSFYLLALVFLDLAAQPLFNTIPLSEFGFLTNQNAPIQPENTLNQNQPLRTNDFQPLQSTFALDGQVIRMGTFYVSQSASGIGLTHAATQDIEVDSITTPTDETQLLFGCVESTSLARLSNNFTNPNDVIATSQALTLTYYISTNAAPTSTSDDLTFTDYNVIGNAYHDIQYVNLTPTIISSGPTISRIFVDDIRRSLVTPPREGRKIRLDLSNGQTWLIYVEQSDRPLFFSVGTDENLITAVRSFTGFLRIATLQTSEVENTGTTDFFPTPEVEDTWSTAAVTQTFPPTPIAMYLLWPYQWIPKVGRQINRNIAERFEMPSCPIITSLLPLLARFDPRTAFLYLNRIQPTEFLDGNNLFITTYMMLIAQKLGADMDLYQITDRPPPAYGIVPSAAATEAAYDAHRTAIPISAEIAFTEDKVTWSYITLGEGELLILFPGYKTLDTATPIAGFAFLDPIKGPLYGVETTALTIDFAEGPVPSFYEDSFLPPVSFTQSELAQLQRAFVQVQFDSITGTDLITAGKQAYELAITVRLALDVFAQIGYSRGAQIRLLNGLSTKVKAELIAWLITRTFDGFTLLPDYFIGDDLAPGVCTVAGVSTASEENSTVDESNGLYSNHHTAYGYWLMAAAFMIEYDQALDIPRPFISQMITSTFGGDVNTPPSPHIVKDFVDFLWRDTRNPDREDADGFPYNRHGNPWEGHSTANGMLYTPLSTGRLQELFAEDFNSWAAVREYARAVLASSALSDEDKEGFETLATFAQTNLQLTATSGKLIYQDDSWLYSFPYTVNTTVGQVSDTQTEAATTLEPGTPSCVLLTPNNYRR